MDDRLRQLDLVGLRRSYATKELSPTEYVRATLDAVAAIDPGLGAFLTVDAEGALDRARTAERTLRTEGGAAFRSRPLLGVPVSVKDLTPTRGLRTTRGAVALRDWVPDEDAPAVARLRRAGAVLIGKTNTSEGGWSAATRNLLAPPTANPWNVARSAGGSSGGAAAAVAAGLGVAATGTDGAGSIRIPASFCGVVGFKPTFGRIPYAPVSPERLSHLGPITRSVADAGILLDVLAGPDPADPYSLDLPGEPHGSTPDVLRIGWIARPGQLTPQPDVLDRCGRAVATLAALGHVVEAIDAPFDDPYPTLVTVLAAAEAAGQPAQRDPLADPDRLAVVAHGRRLTAADLMRAEAERAALRQRLHACMSRYDLLVMPTVPVEPFDRAAIRPDHGADGSPLDWLAWAPACHPFNLTGQPAVSIPVGFGATGLPVGLQLVGAWHRDSVVLRAAHDLEAALPATGVPPRPESQDLR
ncbi:amidase family protein [Micromonospora sp. NPDC023956]|uniref:amidase n=1 Tax=Micromonospora sp. NPDC023956 TaxID=3155722 RepID=UPI0033EA80B5